MSANVGVDAIYREAEIWNTPGSVAPLRRLLRAPGFFISHKPLGAFGGFILLLPILASIFGPRFEIGPLSFPRLTPYSYDDYELGRDVLLGPSFSPGYEPSRPGSVQPAALRGRISFAIGWSVYFLSTTMSVTLTLISGYYVRTVDIFLQRVVEIVAFVPDIILIVAIFSIYGANPIVLVLTLTVIRGFATGRVLSSVVIGVKGLPYIEAAKTIGAGDLRILRRHVFPQVSYLVVVYATGALASAVLVEAGLAVLGFGLDPTLPTFGNLLNSSRQYLRVAPWLAIFPGFTIFMLLLGSRLLGYALRDVTTLASGDRGRQGVSRIARRLSAWRVRASPTLHSPSRTTSVSALWRRSTARPKAGLGQTSRS